MDWKNGQEIKGIVVTIYAVVANTDTEEGRSDDYDKTYHLTQDDAIIASSGCGTFGADAKTEPRWALQIGENEYLLLPSSTIETTNVEEKLARLRRSALDKLTLTESVALVGPKTDA